MQTRRMTTAIALAVGIGLSAGLIPAIIVEFTTEERDAGLPEVAEPVEIRAARSIINDIYEGHSAYLTGMADGFNNAHGISADNSPFHIPDADTFRFSRHYNAGVETQLANGYSLIELEVIIAESTNALMDIDDRIHSFEMDYVETPDEARSAGASVLLGAIEYANIEAYVPQSFLSDVTSWSTRGDERMQSAAAELRSGIGDNLDQLFGGDVAVARAVIAEALSGYDGAGPLLSRLSEGRPEDLRTVSLADVQDPFLTGATEPAELAPGGI